YTAARELGLSIPANLSVAGYDDQPVSRLLSPALTTFAWDIDRIIAATVRLVMAAAAPARRAIAKAVPAGIDRRRASTCLATRHDPLGRGARRLTSCYGPYDHEGLRARYDRIGQRVIGRLMREILLAGEEPHERPPALRSVIADRAAQRRIPGLECI